MTEASTDDAEVLDRFLRERWSCRAFLHERVVPRDVLDRALLMAQRVASGSNTQGWRVHLVGPERVEAFTAALMHGRDRVEPDLPLPTRYEAEYQDRRRTTGFGLYSAIGIEREDREGRERQYHENLRFFGASQVAIVHIPGWMGAYGVIDAGAYVATLMLAFRSLGVDSIAQGAVAELSAVVHEFCEIGDDRAIVCAVAFGYADHEHPANRWRTERAGLREVVIDVV